VRLPLGQGATWRPVLDLGDREPRSSAELWLGRSRARCRGRREEPSRKSGRRIREASTKVRQRFNRSRIKARRSSSRRPSSRDPPCLGRGNGLRRRVAGRLGQRCHDRTRARPSESTVPSGSSASRERLRGVGGSGGGARRSSLLALVRSDASLDKRSASIRRRLFHQCFRTAVYSSTRCASSWPR